MGMGTAAAYADVIGEKAIEKFCPKRWAALQECIAAIDNWEEIARSLGFNEKIGNAEIHEAYHNLCNTFKKKTGLDLNVAYQDRENDGDRYDSDLVDGVYWTVEGMYQLTPAGKKMQKYVSRELFTTFG